MKPISFILFILSIYYSITYAEDTTKQNAEEILLKEGEKKLGDQILLILKHFQQDEPVGIPGVKIPDPKSIPDMKQSFSMAKMNFKNMNVYGLSKMKIAYVKSEISSMEVRGGVTIDSLQVKGNYTMSSWLSRSQGPFQVDINDIFVQGVASLGVERDGKLRAQTINMDITFGKIAMNFENLGFMGSMFQGILNSVGTFLFESIKPFVLKEAYTSMRTEINNNLDKFSDDVRFPNSISPLDMVIADARKKVRAMGMDPYYVKDYNSSAGLFQVQLSHTWLTGISSFYRVGNITLSLANNTVIADLEIGTQKLEGQTQWDIIFMGGVGSRAGTASFSIQYISVHVIVAQPMDTRKHPEFRDLQLEIGNIQVRCDGAGTLDYVVEFLVNVLPNLLRYQITDALEGPIQEKMQEMFNQIQMEELIKSKIPEMEEMSKKGFKLSALKHIDETTLPEQVDEDEFWRFNN